LLLDVVMLVYSIDAVRMWQLTPHDQAGGLDALREEVPRCAG
jgi:hypothetical protein